MFGLVPFANKGLAVNDGFKDLFDVFQEPFFNTDWTKGAATFKVDVKETNDGYELTADLPGVKKENIGLKYENGYLTISTKEEESHDEKDDQGNYIRRERRTGSMSRSFYVDDIDASRVTAAFENGVLKVELPKPVEQTTATQFEIK